MYFSDQEERISKFLELNASKLCTATKNRCTLNGSYIAVDGHDSFYYSDQEMRIEKFLSIVNTAVCN